MTAYYDDGYIYVQGNSDNNKLKYIWVKAIFEDLDTDNDSEDADEDDITYDEVSAGLLIGEVRRQRQDLFEAMQMYYRIYILKENPADILTDEDE